MLETTQPEVGNLEAQPEANAPEQSQQTGTVDKTPEQPFLTVKYNKEDKPLSKEEAIEFIQRGLNVEKTNELKQRLQELETKNKELEESELLQFARELAEESGSSISEIGKRLRKQRTERLDSDRAKEEGITPEAARKLREAEEKAYKEKIRAQTAEEKASQLEREKESANVWKEQIVEFKQSHSDVDIENLIRSDGEFAELWGTGIPLEKAYGIYSKQKDLERKLNEMAEQTKVNETNAANSAASTGALGTGATLEKPLTYEEVDKMSPAELEKNHERIAKLYGWRK